MRPERRQLRAEVWYDDRSDPQWPGWCLRRFWQDGSQDDTPLDEVDEANEAEAIGEARRRYLQDECPLYVMNPGGGPEGRLVA